MSPRTASAEEIRALFRQYVVPSYGRFDAVFVQGRGRHLWDVDGRRYLDLGGGVAVTSLGHAHPEITAALLEQAQRLIHVSNLYYHEGQGVLAKRLVERIGEGKCFFANSGAEANEGLFKLARRFGQSTGRFEIITTLNSFHGRTLAAIAATGQEKIKQGFAPAVPGFVHVPFNELRAVEESITATTAAVLVEGVQGEGGITPAHAEYLLGLRALCNRHNLLLLFDAVQCGFYRTGRFQSYQRILEGRGADFLPDAISMAKSLGAGFPVGAFWVRAPYADLLDAGSHGSTFGGNPLACAVANCALDVVERERLEENVREVGAFLASGLGELKERFPKIISEVRGLGFILGVQIHPAVFSATDKPPAKQLAAHLLQHGVLVVPAEQNVVRLLPPLNLSRAEAEEGLALLSQAFSAL